MSRGEAEQLAEQPRDPNEGTSGFAREQRETLVLFLHPQNFTLPHLCVLRNCDLDRLPSPQASEVV